MANGSQLQQVLLNLMINSSHATEDSHTKNVTVRVVQVGQKAQIQIEDTGKGIPNDIQKKIFEPFFTTKAAGKGAGLGLAGTGGWVRGAPQKGWRPPDDRLHLRRNGKRSGHNLGDRCGDRGNQRKMIRPAAEIKDATRFFHWP